MWRLEALACAATGITAAAALALSILLRPPHHHQPEPVCKDRTRPLTPPQE